MAIAAPSLAHDSTTERSSDLLLFTALGAMVGAGLAVASSNDCRGRCFDIPIISIPIGGLLGAAGGLFVGAIVGAFTTPPPATE